MPARPRSESGHRENCAAVDRMRRIGCSRVRPADNYEGWLCSTRSLACIKERPGTVSCQNASRARCKCAVSRRDLPRKDGSHANRGRYRPGDDAAAANQWVDSRARLGHRPRRRRRPGRADLPLGRKGRLAKSWLAGHIPSSSRCRGDLAMAAVCSCRNKR